MTTILTSSYAYVGWYNSTVDTMLGFIVMWHLCPSTDPWYNGTRLLFGSMLEWSGVLPTDHSTQLLLPGGHSLCSAGRGDGLLGEEDRCGRDHLRESHKGHGSCSNVTVKPLYLYDCCKILLCFTSKFFYCLYGLYSKKFWYSGLQVAWHCKFS